MSAKAISEFDGKKILAKYLVSPPSHDSTSDSNTTTPLPFAPSTRLARVNLVSGREAYKPNAAIQAFADTAIQDLRIQLDSIFEALEKSEPWLSTDKLVVKPDQLIKRRGKLGLLGINMDFANVKKWIYERAGTEIKVCLSYFCFNLFRYFLPRTIM